MIETVMEPMLTVSDVAHILNVSEETVRRWLRDEELTGMQVGNEWRVERTDLKAFIDRNKRPRRRGRG